MKFIHILILISTPILSNGQQSIGAKQSAAFSSNEHAFTVGDIFLDSYTGLLGVISEVSIITSDGLTISSVSTSYSIYPNPTYKNITIKGEDLRGLKYTVTSIDGIHISTKEINSENIDLTYLVSGTYILLLNEKSIKFIKL